MRETKKIESFFKSGQNHKVIHHLKCHFLKDSKYHHFDWKSLRNQNTLTKQMKNERVLKVTEKYNEKWMFLMKNETK